MEHTPVWNNIKFTIASTKIDELVKLSIFHNINLFVSGMTQPVQRGMKMSWKNMLKL